MAAYCNGIRGIIGVGEFELVFRAFDAEHCYVLAAAPSATLKVRS